MSFALEIRNLIAESIQSSVAQIVEDFEIEGKYNALSTVRAIKVAVASAMKLSQERRKYIDEDKIVTMAQFEMVNALFELQLESMKRQKDNEAKKRR